MKSNDAQHEPCLPSSRRQDGVYYTPEPVVRAVVRWTLDGIPDEFSLLSPPRILAPACGQGVFLIETYRYLARRAAELFGVEQLDYDDRCKLLLSSISGVDVDAPSVRIAR